jgi:phenylalanyl-tRNA synthetase alpha subunit
MEAIYKDSYTWNIVEDYNPYTDPTLEVELPYQGKLLELLGSGVLRPELLQLLDLDPDIYNARAW